MFQMSINLRLDVFFFSFYPVLPTQLCSLDFPPAVEVTEECSLSVLRCVERAQLNGRCFVPVCVFQMYLVEHVTIHPVHKKLVPSMANAIITLYDALITSR